jgi:predicted dehydrogenase
MLGLPLGISAEVERERDGEGANDSIVIRLRYAEMRATLVSNLLTSPAGPRFVLRGTRGNYRKSGIDPQEAALSKITRIESAHWGEEPQSEWGVLNVDEGAGIVSRPLETLPGDYRCFYEGVREALAGHAEPPVKPEDAWRVARVLEMAEESARQRCEIAANWENEAAHR